MYDKIFKSKIIKKDSELISKLAKKYPNEWILFRTNEDREILEVIAHDEDDTVIDKIASRTEVKEGEFIIETFGYES